MVWGLLAAVGTSIGYAVATVLQAVGSKRAEGLAALVQPLVVAGLAVDGVAFLLSLVAYRRLSLFLVQTIIAASVAGVVLLAVPVLKVRLRRADWIAVGAVVVALAVLGGAGGEQPPAPAGHGLVVAVLVGAGVLGVALLALYRAGPAWAFGAISALGYSGVAVGARAARTGGGFWAVVLQPLALAVVVFGAVAVVAYVRALEVGPVGLAAALVSVIEVVVPGVVGLVVFGDGVRPGWAVPAGLAVVIALAACTVLSRSPANEAAG